MKTTTIYPAVGHELNEPRFRGRVFDKASTPTRFLDRVETLKEFDDGTLEAMTSRPRSVHPSYHTREAKGGGIYIDASSPIVSMSREEIVDMFDRADAIKSRIEHA